MAANPEAASSVWQLPTIGVKGSGTGFCVGWDGGITRRSLNAPNSDGYLPNTPNRDIQ